MQLAIENSGLQSVNWYMGVGLVMQLFGVLFHDVTMLS